MAKVGSIRAHRHTQTRLQYRHKHTYLQHTHMCAGLALTIFLTQALPSRFHTRTHTHTHTHTQRHTKTHTHKHTHMLCLASCHFAFCYHCTRKVVWPAALACSGVLFKFLFYINVCRCASEQCPRPYFRLVYSHVQLIR